MRNALSDLNRKWEAAGDLLFRHGIGIHSGEVVAASIGSPQRLSYLMVGDTVNLASRIQGMTKELDCDILISGETRRLLPERFFAEYVRALSDLRRHSRQPLFRMIHAAPLS